MVNRIEKLEAELLSIARSMKPSEFRIFLMRDKKFTKFAGPLTSIKWPSWIKIYKESKALARKYEPATDGHIFYNALLQLASIRANDQPIQSQLDWGNLQHCELCWRFAPATGIYHYCPEHRPCGGQKDYRRARRKLPLFQSEYRRLMDRLRDTGDDALYVPENDAILRDWLNRYFPRVYGYIGRPPNLTVGTILHLLDTQDGRRERIKLHTHTILNRDELTSVIRQAEAWLSTREIDNRGDASRLTSPPRKIDICKARSLRKEGNSLAKIGRYFGVTRQAVYKSLRQTKLVFTHE